MSTTDKNNFDQLRAKMSPESRARAEAKAAKYSAEIEAVPPEEQIASLQSELAQLRTERDEALMVLGHDEKPLPWPSITHRGDVPNPFRIRKVNLVCWKLYFLEVFIGSYTTEGRAQNHINTLGAKYEKLVKAYAQSELRRIRIAGAQCLEDLNLALCSHKCGATDKFSDAFVQFAEAMGMAGRDPRRLVQREMESKPEDWKARAEKAESELERARQLLLQAQSECDELAAARIDEILESWTK